MIKLMRFTGERDPDLDIMNREDWKAFNYIFGESMKDQARILKFKNNSKYKTIPDILVGGITYILVSEAAKTILQKFEDVNVEFLPVLIKNRWKTLNYYIFNVLTKCDCVDFSKSDLIIKYDRIFYINKLILDDAKIKDYPYFVIDKQAMQLIAFKENVINELKKLPNLYGVVFYKPEEYIS